MAKKKEEKPQKKSEEELQKTKKEEKVQENTTSSIEAESVTVATSTIKKTSTLKKETLSKDDLETMVLENEDRIKKLESLIANISNLNPEAIQLSNLFELHLKVAGMKFGKEVGMQVADAAEKAKTAYEKSLNASGEAKKAIEIAKSIELSTDKVLKAANAALEVTEGIETALEEMRKIGDFVDNTSKSLDEKLSLFETQIDEKMEAFRQEMYKNSTPAITVPKTKPWETSPRMQRG